jgi:hypothetical protein
MKYLFPLIATSRDGESVLLRDATEFRAFVRGRDVGERFSSWTRAYDRVLGTYRWVERQTGWIVRDDRGLVVLPDSLDEPRSVNWRKRYRNRRGDFEHRSGPVPGLRLGRGCGRPSQAARKRHGGRGVAARNAEFNAGPIDTGGD